MGVLAPGSAHARPSARPPSTRAEIRSFRILGQLLKLPPLSAQKCHSAGIGGGPQFLLFIGILIFLLLRNPCKISEPYDNPFWGFEQRRREKKKINSAHADEGSMLTVCACFTVRSSPHQHEWKFSGTCPYCC